MKANDFYKSKQDLKTAEEKIVNIQEQLNNLEVPSLTRPLEFLIKVADWTLNEAGFYEYTLVHNRNIQREALAMKFYKGNESYLLSYTWIDNNTAKIFNVKNEDVSAILGDFINVNFYTKPEIDEKLLALEEMAPTWKPITGKGCITIKNTLPGFTKDMVIKGNTTGGYNSETGQANPLVFSCEAEDNKLIVKSCGKNLLNPNEMIKNSLYSYDGIAIASDRGEDTRRWEDVKPCSVKLTGSHKFTVFNECNHEIEIHSRSVLEESTQVLVVPVGQSKVYTPVFKDSEMRVKLFARDKTTLKSKAKFLLEPGTTATQYEEYKEDRREIKLPVEFGHGGLVNVQDEYYDTGTYIKKLKRVILNGSEYWSLSANYDSSECIVAFCSHGEYSPSSRDVLSDMFIAGSITNTQENFERIVIGSNGKLYIKILKSKLTTLDGDGIKNYFKTNNCVVLGKLATPIIYHLNEANISTFDRITNIIQENTICGEMQLEIPENKDSIISSNTRKAYANAKELAECIKRDGSVEMKNVLTFQGEWNGISYKNDAREEHFFTQMGNGGYVQTGYEKSGVVDYIYQLEQAGLVPMVSNTKNLGSSNRPWKDAWIGNVNKADNGYCKLTNGMIMQWKHMGAVDETNSGAQHTFPIAFPNTSLFVTASEVFSNNIDNFYKAWAVSGTHFAYYTNSKQKNDCYIIAIGY